MGCWMRTVEGQQSMQLLKYKWGMSWVRKQGKGHRMFTHNIDIFKKLLKYNLVFSVNWSTEYTISSVKDQNWENIKHEWNKYVPSLYQMDSQPMQTVFQLQRLSKVLQHVQTWVSCLIFPEVRNNLNKIAKWNARTSQIKGRDRNKMWLTRCFIVMRMLSITEPNRKGRHLNCN